MTQDSSNKSGPPGNGNVTQQHTVDAETKQYQLIEGTSQLTNYTSDTEYGPSSSVERAIKHTAGQQLLQTEADQRLIMEAKDHQTVEMPDKQSSIRPESISTFFTESDGQLAMKLEGQVVEEPSFVQEWRDRGYSIRVSKGSYYVISGHNYIGKLDSSGNLILKKPSNVDNDTESYLNDELVRKWRNRGYTIRMISGTYYVCDGRIFKGVLGPDGEVIGEDLPVKEPLQDVQARQETWESILDENTRRYVQEWRDRDYRVQVINGRCYVFEKSLYIGTIGEVGELLVKASRDDDNEKHAEKAKKLIGNAAVLKWAERDCEIKVFNDKCYVCRNLVLIGILGDDGEISVEFPAGISRHEALQFTVWRRLYAIRPTVASFSDLEIREAGFTISSMHFLGPEWIEIYGNNSFDVFQRVILGVSRFSFLADFPLAEKEYTFGQLTTSSCILGSIIEKKSSCTLHALYDLMGSINLVYTSGKAILSKITDEQWEFCEKYDIPIHGFIERICE